METYINLDLSQNSRPTSYAFLYNQSPTPVINFFIHNEHYPLRLSEFTSLQLRVNTSSDEIRIFLLDNANIINENGNWFVQWSVPLYISNMIGENSIQATIITSSGETVLSQFKIVFYETSNTKLELTLRAIRNFNLAYIKYITGIKNFEYESPNGVPKLDEDGIVKWKQIPYYRHRHEQIKDTLSDVYQIHGLRINHETNEWMYYDTDDEFWYFVNQVYGGGFTRPNKDENYNIYGGDFILPLVDEFISADVFTDLPIDMVDASIFTNLPTDLIVAGLFSEAINATQEKLFGGIF